MRCQASEPSFRSLSSTSDCVPFLDSPVLIMHVMFHGRNHCPTASIDVQLQACQALIWIIKICSRSAKPPTSHAMFCQNYCQQSCGLQAIKLYLPSWSIYSVLLLHSSHLHHVHTDIISCHVSMTGITVPLRQMMSDSRPVEPSSRSSRCSRSAKPPRHMPCLSAVNSHVERQAVRALHSIIHVAVWCVCEHTCTSRLSICLSTWG